MVRTLLAYQGKRQADLAAYLDIDSGTMSKAMNGSRRWAVEEIDLMAVFFERNAGIFFEDADSLIRSRWISQLVSA